MRSRIPLALCCLLVPLFSGLLQADDFEDKLADDFTQAWQKVRSEPWWVRSRQLEREAEQLARKHGARAVDALKRKAAKRDKLAFLTLAKLGAEKAVKQAFYELATSTDTNVRGDAMVSLTYLPAEAVRSVATRLAVNPKHRDNPAMAIELLGLMGNEATVSLLDELSKDSENRSLLEMAASAKEAIRERLKRHGREAVPWGLDEEVEYWRHTREIPQCITEELSFLQKAEQLNRSGYRFSLPFLQFRLQRGDPLAAAIMGMQKEEGAVASLAAHAHKGGVFGQMCRFALGAIGTRQSLSEVEGTIRPGKERMNSDTTYLLGSMGDANTLTLLRELSTNMEYSAKSRATFGSCARSLARSLQRRGRTGFQPEMRK